MSMNIILGAVLGVKVIKSEVKGYIDFCWENALKD